ncbi:U3 small nucleolar ribonucleoprotein protein IMP4 [Lepeophtheirus salmonis]|uniref:U3 small nucleolar ribonucleoprotein IMP4like [Apis mellifera] n=1 Tax=Lepeophtheirus salmonis TaxID=72036 RepID=C1BSX9_LEPSM|nr:U3 small nucleolar ribonucleoprotein protein IMP4-like [Lepeophtheirus salmonis]ACO12132.1 U3 small nucleolar ribonucleoprotein protein IMP4 [Lepeophtheirus salmonis]
MIRRQARLRREYLYRKGVEERQNAIQSKKDRLRKALESNSLIDPSLRRDALDLQQSIKWDDDGPRLATTLNSGSGGVDTRNSQDDEYAWAGVSDPKVMLTTSRDPSSRLKKFVKEIKLLVPNSQRINRGNYEFKQLMDACRANEVTDVVIVHEHRGNPDGLIVCHLPFGPTAYFTLSDIVMRHDIPELGNMSEQYPHLVFHNFKSKLGERCTNILKYLFPVPKEDSKRVMTFANHDDYISFRHHTYKKGDGKNIELSEVGPRFQLRLYEIKLGTLESISAANSEWVLRPYMNTAKKRRFLSDDDGFVEHE